MDRDSLVQISSALYELLSPRLPYRWDFCRIPFEPATRLLLNSGSYYVAHIAFVFWFIKYVLKYLEEKYPEGRLEMTFKFLAALFSFTVASQVCWPLFLACTFIFTQSFYPWMSALAVVSFYIFLPPWTEFHDVTSTTEASLTRDDEEMFRCTGGSRTVSKSLPTRWLSSPSATSTGDGNVTDAEIRNLPDIAEGGGDRLRSHEANEANENRQLPSATSTGNGNVTYDEIRNLLDIVEEGGDRLLAHEENEANDNRERSTKKKSKRCISLVPRNTRSGAVYSNSRNVARSSKD